MSTVEGDYKPTHTHTHIYTHIHTHIHIHINTHTYTHIHTHILVIPPNRGRYDTQCIQSVYYMQSGTEHYDVQHAIGDALCSLITGNVTGAHKFSSFVNVLYIRFAIDCTNSQGGDRPRLQNVPGLIVECHTYVPGWRRLHTHTHTHTKPEDSYCASIVARPQMLNRASSWLQTFEPKMKK